MTTQRMACAAMLTTALLLPAVHSPIFQPVLASDPLMPVPGALPDAMRRALGVPLGRLNVQHPLTIAFGLASRDPQGLDRALAAIYNRTSPLYHHFLTPSVYNARFGPDPAAVHALATWLGARGLNVHPWHGGNLLDVTGNAATIGTALRLTLQRYTLAHAVAVIPSLQGSSPAGTGRLEGYAADRAPLLPASVASAVLGVSGLDDIIRPVPLTVPALSTGSRPARRADFGPSGGMDPAQVQTAYDFTPLYANGFHGEHINVDLVELAPYSRSDINAYATQYGVSPNITDVAVDGGAAGQVASLEPTIDIEEISTSAPAAVMRVYSAPNDTTTGVLHAYSAVANARDANIVSLGWAICEPFARTLYGFADIEHSSLKQMALEGITTVAPTDDSGAYACGTSPETSLQGVLAVSLPASDPYVTAVGGTVMTLSPSNTIASETAWSCHSGPGGCGNGRGPEGFGSGGGISSLFGNGDAFGDKLDWQTGPGVQNSYSNGNRQVPDVSISGTYTSGNDHAYSFYYQGSWQNGGGTSAAAPMWASLLALTDQYLAVRGQQPIGWVNPQIYQLGAGGQTYPPYHDITSGDNLYYSATPGWDYATGWGSPDAWNFVRDIGAVAPPPLPTLGPTQPPAIPTATLTLVPSATATLKATSTPTLAVHSPTPTATHRRLTSTPSPTPTRLAPRPATCPASGLGNGGFEGATLVCWQASGGQKPRLNRTVRHTGRAAIALGSTAPLAHPAASILSQSFTLPAGLRRPVLRLDYWLTHTQPLCPRGARCPQIVRHAPQVLILDAHGRTLVTTTLTPRRERAWSSLSLPFPARGTRLTLRILVPAQPMHTSVLLYLDDVSVGS